MAAVTAAVAVGAGMAYSANRQGAMAKSPAGRRSRAGGDGSNGGQLAPGLDALDHDRIQARPGRIDSCGVPGRARAQHCQARRNAVRHCGYLGGVNRRRNARESAIKRRRGRGRGSR